MKGWIHLVTRDACDFLSIPIGEKIIESHF
jgi:hypothetical protein